MKQELLKNPSKLAVEFTVEKFSAEPAFPRDQTEILYDLQRQGVVSVVFVPQDFAIGTGNFIVTVRQPQFDEFYCILEQKFLPNGAPRKMEVEDENLRKKYAHVISVILHKCELALARTYQLILKSICLKEESRCSESIVKRITLHLFLSIFSGR